MSAFVDMLARARVAAATRRWPPDLARQVVEELRTRATAAELLEARNMELRRAAARISGSRWAKARRIEREMLALRSGRARAARSLDGVRELVALALELMPMPASGIAREGLTHRRLLEILDD